MMLEKQAVSKKRSTLGNIYTAGSRTSCLPCFYRLVRVEPLLRPGIDYEIDEAIFMVHEDYIRPMKGDPYKGEDNLFEE